MLMSSLMTAMMMRQKEILDSSPSGLNGMLHGFYVYTIFMLIHICAQFCFSPQRQKDKMCFLKLQFLLYLLLDL